MWPSIRTVTAISVLICHFHRGPASVGRLVDGQCSRFSGDGSHLSRLNRCCGLSVVAFISIRWDCCGHRSRPADQVCVLRSFVRHRDSLIQAASSHVLRMQKALNQMNLRIHHVISDITGVSGLRIMEAVLAGERDPIKLAALRDGRVKASQETMSLAAWRHFRKLMAECDRAIESN